jgi:hypothetical protein
LALGAAFLILLVFPISVSAEEPVAAEVRMYLGRPTVFLDGKPQALGLYCPALQPKNFYKNLDRFFQHDVAAYFIYIPHVKNSGAEYDFFACPFWKGDEVSSTPLFEAAEPSLDEQTAYILKHNPNAYFIVRLTGHEPKNWRDLHPNELCKTEDGSVLPHPSPASSLYYKDQGRCLKAEIEYCESRSWGTRVIGYWTGMRTEGTHDFLIEGHLYDHSPVMLERWHKFLKDKYVSDEKLQHAWSDPAIKLESVDVPKETLRGPTRDVSASLYWQPASENQPYRDYIELQRTLFHAGFRELAAASRAGTDRKRFFITDSLKQTMLGWENVAYNRNGANWPLAYHDMLAGSGSVNATDLFDAAGFDGVITPYDYQARGIGGVSEAEGMTDSCTLRGKLFFAEADVRTWTGIDKGMYFAARNTKELAAITWRNLATSFTRGYNSYNMDLFTDWFADAEMHPTLHRQYEVWKQSIDWPREDVPGIAIVLDDTAALETNGNGAFLNLAVMWEQKTGIARCGVPYRIYQFDDLKLDNFPKHRVFYFPNLFRIDDERMKVLRKTVFRDGNVVLWGPGSGISDGKTIGAEHAAALTGFEFDIIQANYPRRVQIQDFSHPITHELDEGVLIGDTLPYGPCLFPKNGRSLGMAWTQLGRTYSGLSVLSFGKGARSENAAGVALGEGDWASVFTTAVPIPPNMWRGLARLAGAHVYCQSNDVLLACSRMVALHSIKSGKKHIDLPEACDVTDVISGKPIATNTKQIEFDLDAPETRVFLLSPR